MAASSREFSAIAAALVFCPIASNLNDTKGHMGAKPPRLRHPRDE
jgi:hypothetical protein